MTTPDASTCVESLERISVSVIDAVIRNDTSKLETLVIEQCQWVRQLQGQAVADDLKLRLQQVAKSITTQQVLIGQALHVSEFFLQRMSENRTFNDFG